MESLLFFDLVDDAVSETEEIYCLELETGLLEGLECAREGLQGTEASEVLSFCIFIVTDSLLDSPVVVTALHDVFVRLKTGEDRNLVHLVFLQAHEEVIDVTVFALHYNLGEGPWQLLLLRGQERSAGKCAHSCFDERGNDQPEHFTLLKD